MAENGNTGATKPCPQSGGIEPYSPAPAPPPTKRRPKLVDPIKQAVSIVATDEFKRYASEMANKQKVEATDPHPYWNYVNHGRTNVIFGDARDTPFYFNYLNHLHEENRLLATEAGSSRHDR